MFLNTFYGTRMVVWGNSILLFIFIAICSAYDLEVSMKMDEEFIDKIKMFLRRRGDPVAVQFEVNVPSDILRQLGFDENQLFRSLDQKIPDVLSSLVKELTKRASERINVTSLELKSKLKSDVEVDTRLQHSTEKFKFKFNRYIDNSLKLNTEIPLDKEMLVLDTIEAANEITFNETKRFIEKIGKNNKTDEFDKLLQDAYKQNLVHRKEDYKFLCEKLSFCRPYPGYFDFFGGLLREVTKLSDNKLHAFVMKTSKIIKNRSNFFEIITGKKTSKKMGLKLQNLIDDDLTELKDTIQSAREIINQRRRWIYDDNVVLNNKKRAIRILMDIVDATFEKNGEQAVMSHFDGTVKALREWDKSLRNDIETVIYTFITYTIDALENSWNENTLSEVYTIVQLIWNGKAKKGVNEYLLTHGSNFTSKLPIA